MSYTSIPSFPSGGDVRIGQNPNATNDYAHVKAFIAAFRPYAATASRRLSGLPIRFILAPGPRNRLGPQRGPGRRPKTGPTSPTPIPPTPPATQATTSLAAAGIAPSRAQAASPTALFPFFTDRAKPDSAVSQTYRSMLRAASRRSQPQPRSPRGLSPAGTIQFLLFLRAPGFQHLPHGRRPLRRGVIPPAQQREPRRGSFCCFFPP